MLDDKLKSQLDSIRIMLDDDISAEGLCRKVLTQIENLDFPSERVAALQLKLVEFKTTVENARRQDQPHVIRRAAVQLLQDAQALARPERLLTPEEVVARIFAGLQASGWASFTIHDLLPRELRAGDIVVRYDADAVIVRNAAGETRVIKRFELIHKYRPPNLTKDHEADWMRQNKRLEILQRRAEPSS